MRHPGIAAVLTTLTTTTAGLAMLKAALKNRCAEPFVEVGFDFILSLVYE